MLGSQILVPVLLGAVKVEQDQKRAARSVWDLKQAGTKGEQRNLICEVYCKEIEKSFCEHVQLSV